MNVVKLNAATFDATYWDHVGKVGIAMPRVEMLIKVAGVLVLGSRPNRRKDCMT